MKKILCAVIAGSLFLPSLASAQVYVKGYFKGNGTYVAPYYRSSPNGTKLDNYSTMGNINPYTGAMGTVNPYSNSNSHTPLPIYTPPPPPPSDDPSDDNPY